MTYQIEDVTRLLREANAPTRPINRSALHDIAELMNAAGGSHGWTQQQRMNVATLDRSRQAAHKLMDALPDVIGSIQKTPYIQIPGEDEEVAAQWRDHREKKLNDLHLALKILERYFPRDLPPPSFPSTLKLTAKLILDDYRKAFRSGSDHHDGPAVRFITAVLREIGFEATGGRPLTPDGVSKMLKRQQRSDVRDKST